MLSERDRQSLTDIRTNIRLAQSFVEGSSFEAFQKSPMLVYAVTHAIEVVSEASRRLSAEVKERHPQLPWRDIASIGNILRHDYSDVSDSILWNTVQTNLPVLMAVVEAELRA